MKIIFDHQIFSAQKHGGVSKYFVELIRNLPTDSWETTTLFSNNEYVKFYKLFSVLPLFDKFTFKGKGRIISELNIPYSKVKLWRKKFDVFHQTDFNPYCLKVIGDKPMVTTFHDINFLTIDKNESRVKFQKQSLARANKIIAISENTKKDLIKYYQIESQKIEVIHHGVSHTSIPNKFKDRLIDAPYLLFVGLRRDFKNFKGFIQAFATIHHRYPDLKVVCTRNDFDKSELHLFKELGICDRLIFKEADEITMACLYRDAEVFVFPSFYEGFGMPILEAMVNNCAVALSKASCFPEIAGDSGMYFDPNNVESIADSISQLLDNPSMKKDLIKKGKERVKLFTWEECARKHKLLYKSLLSVY